MQDCIANLGSCAYSGAYEDFTGINASEQPNIASSFLGICTPGRALVVGRARRRAVE